MFEFLLFYLLTTVHLRKPSFVTNKKCFFKFKNLEVNKTGKMAKINEMLYSKECSASQKQNANKLHFPSSTA